MYIYDTVTIFTGSDFMFGGSMKKRRIVLIVLAVVLILLAAVGIWQRENIKAFVDSLRYSQDQIERKLDDNTQKMQEIVDKTDYIQIRGALTPEEEKALASGEITSNEAMQIVKGDTTLESLRDLKDKDSSQTANTPDVKDNSSDGKNNQTSLPPTEPVQPAKQPTAADIMQEEVSSIVAQLYVEKSNFVGQLEALANQAVASYEALGGGKEKATEIMNSYLPTVASLESSADQKVNALLSQLEASLKKGGGDLSLVNEVRQCYYEEKSLKKSYYLSKIYG